MSHFFSDDLITHGIKMHYYRTGGEKPPMILVHGMSDDGLCWTPIAEALSDGFDVVMPDLRGHGLSEAPDTGYTLDVIADEVAGFITCLGLINPILLGHSLGADVILTLAGAYPSIPRAILLEDPPPFWKIKQPTKGDTRAAGSLPGWMAALKDKSYDELFEEVRAANPHWSEAEYEPWVRAKLHFSPRISQMAIMQHVAPMNFPDMIRKVTCPTLFISADPKRGAISTDADIEYLQTLVPQLKRVHIPGAGHSIRRDQFEMYMKSIAQFMEQNKLT